MRRVPRSEARTLRLAAALLVALTVIVGLPSSASAHAYLEHTNPGDGAVLDRAPSRLSLSFSEHVVLDATRIELVDERGRTTQLGGLALQTDARDDTEVPSVVSAALPDLPRGSYRVRWETLSSDDLHRTSGYLVFGIRTAVTRAGFEEPRPQVPESGLRWLVLLGLGVALGSVSVTRLLGSVPRAPGRGRLVLLGRLGAGLAILAAIALLINQVVADHLSLARLLASGYGARWSLREVGLVALFVGLGGAPTTRSRSGLAVGGAVLAAVGGAMLGHAGADPGVAGIRVAVTAVHLTTVLTWIGGVIALAVAVLPAVRAGEVGTSEVRTILRRFGLPAATMLGLGAASGLFLAGESVASVDAVLATTYGRVLLVKLGLVGALCLVALSNHRRLRGPHDLDLPVRGVRAEAVTAVLLLAATAVLTSAQPATEPEFRAQPHATVGPVSGRADDLQVGVDVSPGVAGPNVISVTVFDTRRPAPGEVTDVRIGTGTGTSHVATPLGDGRWSVAGLRLPAGPRTLTVSVERPGLAETSFQTPWTLGAGGARRETMVSVASVQPLLRGLALLLILAMAVWRSAQWTLRRHDRRRARERSQEASTAGAPARRAEGVR